MRFFKILCKHYNLCPYHISPTINPSSLPFILSFYSKFNIFIVHPSSFQRSSFVLHRSSFIVPKFIIRPSSFNVAKVLHRSKVHRSKGSSFIIHRCKVVHPSSFNLHHSSFIVPMFVLHRSKIQHPKSLLIFSQNLLSNH